MGFKNGVRRLLAAGLGALAFLAMPALARTVLELDESRQPVALQDWGDAWIDASGQLPVDKVATGPGPVWRHTHASAIYPLGTGNALWIRFTVPPAPDAERWYLEIPSPSVNRVTLYTPDSVGKWSPQTAGDMLAVAQWPVPHRHPLLPIAVSAEEPRSYLLRVENSYQFSAPLRFVSESRLSHSEQRTSLILGIYFGLAGLAVALALLSAVSLRDPTYAYYAMAVTFMALTQAAMTGIAGLHLWPGLPWWNNLSFQVLPVLTVASLVWFASGAVSLQDRSPGLHRLMAGLSLAGLAAAVAIALAEPSRRLAITLFYLAAATALGMAAIAWSARRGDRYGGWLLAASLPVVISAAFPLAWAAGLAPLSFWTLHAMQLGIAIELPLVMVILMLRSQQRREHNRRVQGLDRVDPATGLINAHVFTERLVRMTARAKRLKYQSAVLLVDIVNIEQMRREFDRSSAEELPLQVAGRLLSAAREIDSVARLSELRFGILVEGPLTPEEAAEAGPRVVARCLMPFKNKPLEWVAQVRIAQTLVPLPANDAQTVIARLSAVLAAVPADSKRAVFAMKWADPVQGAAVAATP